MDAPQTPDPSFDPLNMVPATIISRTAFQLASKLLSPAILNHSLRVYLYAKALAQESHSFFVSDPPKHDILFTACIMHDIGTSSTYDGPQRFEVEGADAAVAHLISHGVSESDAHQAWIAIALHTSPGIAERINELTSIVRRAVLIDFGRKVGGSPERLEQLTVDLEGKLPRLRIEKVLGDAVVEQAVRRPEKAPAASWPNNLYKAYLADPEWDGDNKGF